MLGKATAIYVRAHGSSVCLEVSLSMRLHEHFSEKICSYRRVFGLIMRPVLGAAITISVLNLTVRKTCSNLVFPKNCQRLESASP